LKVLHTGEATKGIEAVKSMIVSLIHYFEKVNRGKKQNMAQESFYKITGHCERRIYV